MPYAAAHELQKDLLPNGELPRDIHATKESSGVSGCPDLVITAVNGKSFISELTNFPVLVL